MTAPTSTLQPIYNQAILYKTGLTYSVASNTTLTVNSGICRDRTDSFDINVGDFFGAQSTTTVNIATTGLNALDTGTVAASTVYALFAIADAAGYNPSGLLLSTSLTAPVLPQGSFPSGYNTFRRIGWATTDASSHFLTVFIGGGGNTNFIFYDLPVRVLNAGTSATQAAVSLATAVPAVANMTVILGADFTNNAASDTAKICTSGGTIASSQNLMTGQVAGIVLSQEFLVPVTLISSLPKIDYILSTASASLSLYVKGFIELL